MSNKFNQALTTTMCSYKVLKKIENIVTSVEEQYNCHTNYIIDTGKNIVLFYINNHTLEVKTKQNKDLTDVSIRVFPEQDIDKDVKTIVSKVIDRIYKEIPITTSNTYPDNNWDTKENSTPINIEAIKNILSKYNIRIVSEYENQNCYYIGMVDNIDDYGFNQPQVMLTIDTHNPTNSFMNKKYGVDKDYNDRLNCAFTEIHEYLKGKSDNIASDNEKEEIVKNRYDNIEKEMENPDNEYLLGNQTYYNGKYIDLDELENTLKECGAKQVYHQDLYNCAFIDIVHVVFDDCIITITEDYGISKKISTKLSTTVKFWSAESEIYDNKEVDKELVKEIKRQRKEFKKKQYVVNDIIYSFYYGSKCD